MSTRRRRHESAGTLETLQARLLVEAKEGRTISVCIPARNEAETISKIVSALREKLVLAVPLIDEIIVMDHASRDDTAALARAAGARVVATNEILPDFGPAIGKGDVLWRSLQVTTADFIVWIDADLRLFTPGHVTQLLGPLLLDDRIALVRAIHERYLNGVAAEGGRVTELTARPALKLLFPELAHIRQPLGGEYAVRRDVVEAVPFEVDYGVEMGLLIDIAQLAGTAAITQVDLGPLAHRNRPLHELHEQAGQVLRAILRRASSFRLQVDIPIRPPMKLVRPNSYAGAR